MISKNSSEYQEIERKFLVEDDDFIARLGEGSPIVQGYFGAGPQSSVRVRYWVLTGTYTVAVKLGPSAIARTEAEAEVDAALGEALLLAAGDRVIEKRRVPVAGPDGKGWVVDVFHGGSEGLVLAELELQDLDETFVTPEWCSREVTGDHRYYNEHLSANPFGSWPTG